MSSTFILTKLNKYTFDDDLQAKQRDKLMDAAITKKHLSHLETSKGGKRHETDVNEFNNSENFAKTINRNLASRQELIK